MGNQLLRQRSGRGATGWPAVTLIGAAFAITMLGTTLPTPLYPLYEKAFGFGELVTTVVFAAYAVGVTAALLVFGHWSDQLGRRVWSGVRRAACSGSPLRPTCSSCRRPAAWACN